MKILLIDDEPDIRRIGAAALSKLGGFEVLEAHGGEVGIQQALRDVPDAILLDMMMPGMDGLQTLRAIQADAVLREIPVAFMTARVQSDEVSQYLDAGARGVIPKPFNPLTLASTVKEIFGW